MLFKTKMLARHGCIAFAFFLLSFGVFAQKRVTGKVINNNDKQPIPGAAVQVKGTQM